MIRGLPQGSPWDPKAIRAHWTRRAKDFARVHPRLRTICNLVSEIRPPPKTLLDVGCGPAALREVLPPEIEYFGIDVAPDVIADFHDPTHFDVVDLNLVPQCFGDRVFDVVVCSGIFEYVGDLDRFLSFLRSKLPPGGHLILSHTNHQHYKDGLDWISGRYRRRGYRDPHVNFLLIPATMTLLAEYGFKVDRFVTLTPNGTPSRFFSHAVHFPFNVGSRQYVFLCRRVVPPL